MRQPGTARREHGITIEPEPAGGGALAAHTGQPLPLPLPVDAGPDGGQVAHRPDAACCVEPVVRECPTGTCGTGPGSPRTTRAPLKRSWARQSINHSV